MHSRRDTLHSWQDAVACVREGGRARNIFSQRAVTIIGNVSKVSMKIKVRLKIDVC